MRRYNFSLKLYAITDEKWLKHGSVEDGVEKAAKSGATMVQLREKKMGTEELIKLALRVKSRIRRYGVPLIINDDVEAALASGADGVHVGQEDMAAAEARSRLGGSMILGVSAHTAAQALEAERSGADYIGAGSVFPTTTKDGAGRLSLSELRRICASVSIPVVAIGGINEKNIMELSGSGIVGVAVVSALFASKNIEESTSRLLFLTESMLKNKSVRGEEK